MASLLTHNDVQNNKKIKSSVNGNGSNSAGGVGGGGVPNQPQSAGKLSHSASQGSFNNSFSNNNNSHNNNNGQGFAANSHSSHSKQARHSYSPAPGAIPPNLLNLFK